MVFHDVAELGRWALWRPVNSAGRRLVALFAAENIFCSLEWLLDGTEPGPSSMLIKEAVSAATQGVDRPVTESGCIAESLHCFTVCMLAQLI